MTEQNEESMVRQGEKPAASQARSPEENSVNQTEQTPAAPDEAARQPVQENTAEQAAQPQENTAKPDAADMPRQEENALPEAETAAEPVQLPQENQAGQDAQPQAKPVQPFDYSALPPRAPRRRRNHAALAVILLCLGLSAVVFLAGQVLRITGRPEPQQRPAEGEVEGIVIEERPEDLDGGLSTEEIVRRVGPSVVCINVYRPDVVSVAGSGSGIVLNADGFIITNAHVVEGSSAVEVALADGSTHDAWIVGTDPRTDLAVVKITAENLIPSEFGDSGTLHVGERAIAIGNVAGRLAGSVTQGIISGLDREMQMQTEDGYASIRLIQTDASINPGNSGGALVNRYGQIIGINSARMNSNEYQGIGFAIPVRDAQPVVDDLIAYGYVKDRPALGVVVIALNAVTGPENDLPASGMYISAIEDYSDLLSHDIRVGDVILKADGVQLKGTEDLLNVLKEHRPGETVKLEILKKQSGETVCIDVLLMEKRPD